MSSWFEELKENWSAESAGETMFRVAVLDAALDHIQTSANNFLPSQEANIQPSIQTQPEQPRRVSAPTAPNYELSPLDAIRNSINDAFAEGADHEPVDLNQFKGGL